jgi:branched-chain amino acid aminotransferase
MTSMTGEPVDMSGYDIDPKVPAAIEQFTLPERLGFGQVSAPVMFDAEWRDGQWRRGRLLPYGPIALLPGSRALQYAEVVFEGLKAYRVEGRGPNLFRPDANCRRFAHSAARLSMPPVPDELFFQGIGAVVHACRSIIPTRSGQSLYLRPFLFGSESSYTLRNSSEFRFMVIASPVEPYATGAIKVAIERAEVRAAVGGIGEAKAAANYAASLRASTAAVAAGYSVALWLDGNEHRYLQELSGMNIFAVFEGELHTPELDGAILPGVTRDSLLTLARSLGYTAHERRIALDEVLEGIESGRCSELFACGTAAIVCPIGALVEGDGREYRLRQSDGVAKRLRESLLAIQERRAPDPFGWTRDLSSI